MFIEHLVNQDKSPHAFNKTARHTLHQRSGNGPMTMRTTGHFIRQAAPKLQSEGALEKPVKGRAKAPASTGTESVGCSNYPAP